MRTMLVIVILALVAQPVAVRGQDTQPSGVRQVDSAFGFFADQDLDAVAAMYHERLASPVTIVGPGAETLWGMPSSARANSLFSQSEQPAEESGGGSRFGGPLLWAMVIIAATTVGFVYLGVRLSPGKSANPGEG